MAKAALSKITNHLWYSNHKNVALAFFDPTERVAIACMKRLKKTKNIDHTESDASIKQKVYELANDIKILFKSGRRLPGNEAELQSGLFQYLRQRFGDAAIERYTYDGKRCDIQRKNQSKKFFQKKTPIVMDHIRMGLHSDREGEISIAYSFEDSDMELVSTKGAKK
ncbi:hypothetical protein PV328_003949 [Microctonus aethiopoides]|uniref:Uncharacterized protein n=1 Tax=Microctonus aethiopoides TaxID=144406 RepID=A0AA39F9R2_9HYME|nr:hypothetical protein PV328_003949 [Microctonus aethiopoides]